MLPRHFLPERRDFLPERRDFLPEFFFANFHKICKKNFANFQNSFENLQNHLANFQNCLEILQKSFCKISILLLEICKMIVNWFKIVGVFSKLL